jgi:hypothetical protein
MKEFFENVVMFFDSLFDVIGGAASSGVPSSDFDDDGPNRGMFDCTSSYFGTDE